MSTTAGDVLDMIDDLYMEADDTEKLRHLNRAHARILRAVPIKPTIVTFSSLVSGTREYATGDTYSRVWSVRYVRSSTAGDSKPLKEISVDDLDLNYGDWRAEDAGEPEFFYWRGGFLGLHDKPDTDTTAGYPNLSMEVSALETLTGSSEMPAWVGHYEAWMYDVLESIALARRDWDAVNAFRAKKQESFNELVRMHQGRTARLNPKVLPEIGSSNIERI